MILGFWVEALGYTDILSYFSAECRQIWGFACGLNNYRLQASDRMVSGFGALGAWASRLEGITALGSEPLRACTALLVKP